MITTSIRLTQKQKEKIEAIAEATGVSQQGVMQKAIVKYLEIRPNQIATGRKIIAARDELRGKD